VAGFEERDRTLQNLTFEDENDDEDEYDVWRRTLRILAEDRLKRAGGVGGVAFVAKADLVGDAAGFDGTLKSDGHPDRVGSDGDGGVHEYGICTEFHGFGGVAGCTDSGVHDHGD
jgi:hypothetical protein